MCSVVTVITVEVGRYGGQEVRKQYCIDTKRLRKERTGERMNIHSMKVRKQGRKEGRWCN